MENATIRLSYEEVLFILAAVNARTLPGLTPVTPTEPDAAILGLLRDAGARALIARDLLVPTGDQLSLDRGLYALALACTRPDQLGILSLTQGDKPPVRIFSYRVPELSVRHEPEAFGVHRFQITANHDFGLGVALAALAQLPANEPSSGGPWQVSLSQLSEAEIQARTDRVAAQAILSTLGLPTLCATQLAAAFAQADLNLVIELMSQIQPEPRQSLIRVVAAAEHCWLFMGKSLNDPHVTIHMLSPNAANQLIRQSFAPLGKPH
ncbi:MAG: hypothetical protein AB4911_08195 [Oscillochloridaceae bacterium umkhey_bin13]